MKHVDAELVGETYDQFCEELEFQTVSPPEQDIRVGAFAAATLRVLSHDPDTEAVMKDLIRVRLESGNASASYLANLTLRACQRAFLFGFPNEDFPVHGDDEAYPQSYDKRQNWEANLPRIMASETEFQAYVRSRDVQSNIADRYTSFKLLIELYRDRFGDTPHLLDIGCSADHGLKLLERNEGYYVPNVTQAYLGKHKVDAPHDLKDRIHELVSLPDGIGESVGVDKVPMQLIENDPSTRQWVFACSFYPSELLDKRRYLQYILLGNYQPENIQFIQADFSTSDVEIDPPQDEDGFDMVTFSTVLYQATPKKRETMIENAKRHLKPNGLIVVQDFVNTRRGDPSKLVFPRYWFKEEYGYRTLVFDMQDESAGFQEVFRWQNGRCRELAPNLGALCLQPLIQKAS